MRRVLAAALLLLAASSRPLSAGGRPETGAPGAHASAAGPRFNWKASEGARVRFLANKHPWVDLIRPVIAEFEKLSGVQVEMSVYPEDQFRTKLTIELLSGTSEVDAFMIMPGQDLARYTQSGWLEPLNGYLGSKSLLWPEYDAADLFESALQAGARQGKNYTIPIQLETSLLAYNRDILSRYGVEVPRTMEELLEAARKVYEGSGGRIFGITLRGKKAAATSQWVDFLHSYGGAWLSADGASAVDSPAAIAATRMYGDLLRMYGPKSAPSNSWYESISVFMQGKAAMTYDASVFKAEYENPKTSAVAGRVGYAVIPAGPAGSIPHVSTWSLALYSKSRRKAAAWLFIQWATSREMGLKALLTGVPSARHSAWDSPSFKRGDATPQWTAASLESYKLASTEWNPPVVPVSECRDAVGNAIVAAILGEDVPDALGRAAAQMNRIISSPSRY
jgi:multiple sugar transport system substrate-binding protein